MTLRGWLFNLSIGQQGATSPAFQMVVSEDVIAEAVARWRDKHPTAPGAVTAKMSNDLRTLCTVVQDFDATIPFPGGDEGDVHVHDAATHQQVGYLVTNDRGFHDLSDEQKDTLPYEIYRPDDLFLLLAYDPGLVRVGHYRHDPALAAAHDLLLLPERPSAVFAANDASAIAVIETARALGLSVPLDISVVGYDDVPDASRIVPALTTIRQPLHRVGRAAARTLMTLIDGGSVPEPHPHLRTTLVLRGSTGPARVEEDHETRAPRSPNTQAAGIRSAP